MAVQNEISVAVKVDTAYYEQVAQKATNIGKRFALGLSLAAEGVRILNDFMWESITLAQIQEDAEKKLETALGRRSQALLNQASALQEVTTYGDEAIIGTQALIAAFVKDEGHIKAATQATLDFVAATGMDLTEATDLVTQTLGTSTNALSGYGIIVEGAVGSTERLDTMTTAIAEKFGGQASAATETYSGKIQQLSNRYTNMKEQIGFAVLESGAFDAVLDALNPAVDELTTYIADHKDDISEFAGWLASTAVSAGKGATRIAEDLVPALKGMVSFLEEIGEMVSSIPGGWSTIFGAAAGARIAGKPGAIVGGITGAVMGEQAELERSRNAILRARKKREAARVDEIMERAELQKKHKRFFFPGDPIPSDPDPSGTTNEDAYREGLQKRVEALRGSMMDERQLLEERREEDLALVDKYNKAFTDKDEEARQMRIDIAQKYKEEMAEIEGVPAFIKEVEALQDHNKTKAEIELEEAGERLDRLKWLNEEELLEHEKYLELKDILEADFKKKEIARNEEAADKIRRIEEAKKAALLKTGKSLFSLLANLTLGESKKMFEIQKAAALAAAGISAYESIVHAYKEGVRVGGPALGKIYAINAGIAQAANIAAIASQTYSGGKNTSGGASSAGTSVSESSTTQQVVEPSNSITVYGIDKNSLYSGDQIEAIAEGLNEYMADGGKIYIK